MYQNKIAFSRYFGNFIKVVKYIDDDNWYFVLCTATGKIISDAYKARSPTSSFDWQNINNNER